MEVKQKQRSSRSLRSSVSRKEVHEHSYYYDDMCYASLDGSVLGLYVWDCGAQTLPVLSESYGSSPDSSIMMAFHLEETFLSYLDLRARIRGGV